MKVVDHFRFPCFVDSVYERAQVYTRETLLNWSFHPNVDIYAVETATHKIRALHVLYQTWSIDALQDWFEKLLDGEKVPPIDVTVYIVNHLRYYIPSDGNHRTAAALILGQPMIMARIDSVVDLSDCPITVVDQLVLFQPPGKNGFSHGFKPSNVGEMAAAQTLAHLQAYDYMRYDDGQKIYKRQEHKGD